MELNPDDARALYMAANALVALGERERGLDACRRALEIDPQDPMLLYNVACVLSLAGQIEPARDASPDPCAELTRRSPAGLQWRPEFHPPIDFHRSPPCARSAR